MPLQAGSAVDVMIRIVAQKMSDNIGQQIVIENQPGAAGSIGAERVKRAAPDGYTVGVLNDSILTMIPNRCGTVTLAAEAWPTSDDPRSSNSPPA
jgi:tripartite-type tricarboxylate transporter receptor subunit TctC